MWTKTIATKAWTQPRVSVAPGGAEYLASGWRDSDVVLRRCGPTGSLVWQQVLGRGTRVELWPSDIAARASGPGAWLTFTTYRTSDDRRTRVLQLLRG